MESKIKQNVKILSIHAINDQTTQMKIQKVKQISSLLLRKSLTAI